MDVDDMLRSMTIYACDVPQVGPQARGALDRAGYHSAYDVLRRPSGLQSVPGIGPGRAGSVLQWATECKADAAQVWWHVEARRARQAPIDTAWASCRKDLDRAFVLAWLSPFIVITAPFAFVLALRVRRRVPDENPSVGPGRSRLRFTAVLSAFICTFLASLPGMIIGIRALPPSDQPEAAGDAGLAAVGDWVFFIGFALCAVLCILAWRTAANQGRAIQAGS